MSNQLLEELVSNYFESRPNLQFAHSPLCVFFFACSGSGKSTTRKYLVEKLHATYVCNDEVRELLKNHSEAISAGVELKDVVAGTVEKIFSESPNKFVIFDNNIIQYYMHDDSYLNVATRNKRPTFVVGIRTEPDLLEQRIKSRGVNVDQILNELPGQLVDYKKATKDITPDIELGISENSVQLENLVAKLDRLVKK